MFEDRIAVITGSQRGIGRAIAESLAEQGCNRVISDINGEGAQKTADEIAAKYSKIVNISSVAGLVGSAGQANYASAEAGVIAITKTAAREYASRNITVNAVCPGFILTDMTSNLPDKWKEEVIKQTPLPKRGEPADIAKAVRFLASSDADFITGVILRVDGGMVIGL